MYEYIYGAIALATPSYAVIDCHGVGYKLEITINTYAQIKDLKDVKLLVHYVVREDAHLLFGFFEETEREMFRQLITISGVGVNTARVMLSTLTASELKEAIVTQNVKAIQAVKGIGAKSAQRIILEMQDKVGKMGEGTLGVLFESNKNLDEALSALVMLGFPKAAADKVLQSVNKKQPNLTVEELIKHALKAL